jgi:hypothetical protein
VDFVGVFDVVIVAVEDTFDSTSIGADIFVSCCEDSESIFSGGVVNLCGNVDSVAIGVEFFSLISKYSASFFVIEFDRHSDKFV